MKEEGANDLRGRTKALALRILRMDALLDELNEVLVA
jgi:hypothetical protein